MNAALKLAERGLGDTWPNPSVGCVLVKDGAIIARGVTQSGGRPHAEQVALEWAGAAAKGATAYVTLEPCSHHGKTPPCADALVKAGVVRVVVGTGDTDPRVSGAGNKRLKEAGITVETRGPWEAAAKRLNRGFFLRNAEDRPLFAFKTATGLDGRIAMASGESKWITGVEARRAVQVLRARYDAIMVGSETTVADDPELTCRLDGYSGRPKIRIVVDRRLRLPPKSKLAQTAKTIPTWVLTAAESVSQGQRLTDLGVNLIPVDEPDDNRAFITNSAAILAQMGLTRVLVEGGGKLAASMFDAGLIDEVAWFRAGRIMGGNCRPAVAGLAGDRLADAPGFNHVMSMALGADKFDMYERA